MHNLILPMDGSYMERLVLVEAGGHGVMGENIRRWKPASGASAVDSPDAATRPRVPVVPLAVWL